MSDIDHLEQEFISKINLAHQKSDDTHTSTNDSFSYQNHAFENYDNDFTNCLYQTVFDSDKFNSPELKYKYKKKSMLEESSADRFIPNRKLSKMDIAFQSQNQQANNLETMKENYRFNYEENQITTSDIYKSYILGLNSQKNKKFSELKPFENFNLLKFSQKKDLIKNNNNLFNFDNNYLVKKLDEKQCGIYTSLRKISRVPYKDAPALQDDFYLNLIDWGNPQNILAVGLSSCVYLWNGYNSKVTKLCDMGITDMVTSVQWNNKNGSLAIGTNSGDIQIWDSNKLKKIRTFSGHTSRVGCISWGNGVLTSGSRDKSILHRDIRSSSNFIQKLSSAHKQEVCGLKWSFDEQQLASGGNDNKLFIWNMHSSQPLCKFANHTAAVKALAWNPHQHGLIVSGGGTADRTIRFWNSLNSTQIDAIDTGSQVCNLIFSKNVNELVSTHGYSLNHIILWSYPEMEKLAILQGHSYRVLYLAMNPEGDTIVTGAGDETLRFWNVFPGNQRSKQDKSQQSLLLPKNNSIR